MIELRNFWFDFEGATARLRLSLSTLFMRSFVR
jgi:hypothetical protein